MNRITVNQSVKNKLEWTQDCYSVSQFNTWFQKRVLIVAPFHELNNTCASVMAAARFERCRDVRAGRRSSRDLDLFPRWRFRFRVFLPDRVAPLSTEERGTTPLARPDRSWSGLKTEINTLNTLTSNEVRYLYEKWCSLLIESQISFGLCFWRSSMYLQNAH